MQAIGSLFHRLNIETLARGVPVVTQLIQGRLGLPYFFRVYVLYLSLAPNSGVWINCPVDKAHPMELSKFLKLL